MFRTAFSVCLLSACLLTPVSTFATDPNASPAGDRHEAETDKGLPVNPELQALHDKIRQVIAIYQSRHLNTRDHSPWEVMHGLIAFGIPTQVRRDGPTGEPVSAIGWLNWGNRCRGTPLIVLSGGHVSAQVGPGLQGHPGQYLGMLAQSHVSAESPIELGGKAFKVADLIEQEKLDCQAGTELTFKLIGLAHYLKSDETWTSRDGQTWSISRLIQEEIKQPIRGAACGGTHRLFGLSYAYRMRIKRGEPVNGEFRRAQAYIDEYHRYTFGSLQNRDGSFSTEWFTHAADRPDLDRKLQTTGHIAEWLAFSLTDEQLRDPKMTKAVDFLASALLNSTEKTWSIGPLGHALHALVMCDERLFKETPAASGALAAGADAQTTAKRDIDAQAADSQTIVSEDTVSRDSVSRDKQAPIAEPAATPASLDPSPAADLPAASPTPVLNLP